MPGSQGKRGIRGLPGPPGKSAPERKDHVGGSQLGESLNHLVNYAAVRCQWLLLLLVSLQDLFRFLLCKIYQVQAIRSDVQ